MPSLLITTSRRTSNRVRSFARDLNSVLPGTERFNRGGMGLTELTARIHQSGAQAAIIISIWRGNPGELTFLSSSGTEILKLRLESALLRREIAPTNKGRVGTIESIGLKIGSSTKVLNLAQTLSKLLEVNVHEIFAPEERRTEKNRSLIWLEDAPAGKIHWTHYNTKDLSEIGPRIRVSAIWRKDDNGEIRG